MSGPRECLKCGGRTESGYILDCGKVALQQVWVDGRPKETFLSALNDEVNISGRTILKVATMRCTRCGFLESYACDLGE